MNPHVWPDVLRSLDEVAAAPQAAWYQNLVVFVAIGAIFYFLLIRPENQKRKEHEEMIGALAKDDEVVTSGGLHGRIVSVATDSLVLEIADRTRVTVDRSAVSRKAGQPADNK